MHHQSEVLLLQIQVSRVISQLSDGGRDGLSTWTLTCFKATNRPVLKALMDRLRMLLLYKLEPHILGEYKQLHSSAERRGGVGVGFNGILLQLSSRQVGTQCSRRLGP